MRNPVRKPSTAQEYLKVLPTDQRHALESLRRWILMAVPEAEEHFGYGLPGFKLNGHPLIYFGAAKEHCALYGSVPAGFSKQLEGFDVSKGAIRFTPEKSLPAALVKALVKAKAAENELRWPPTQRRTTRTN